jgi:hypothetical protein
MPRKATTTPALHYDNVAPGPYLFSAIERPNAVPELHWGFIVAGQPDGCANTVRVRVVGDEVFASLDTIPQRRERC